MRPRIKICCIQSVDEARMAVRRGASALGLVSAMPSGPGPIPEERIAEIAATVPPGVTSVLLTSSRDAEEVIAQQRRCGVNAVQLVDDLERGSWADLRRALPGVAVLQVLHVTGEEVVPRALAAAPHVDALLLDSGNPGLTVKELGGTGRRHDWAVSRRIVEAVNVPVWLAGGLRPGNAAEARARVAPFGLDVCTGVRTDGALDEAKLRSFVAAALGRRLTPPGGRGGACGCRRTRRRSRRRSSS